MNITLSLASFLSALVLLALHLHWIRHRQKQEQKHDDILYPFSHLSRDIMEFLYQNTEAGSVTLTPAEYRSVRRLLDVLEQTIRNYSEHRATMFNLRHVRKALREYQQTLEQVLPVDMTENPAIQQFHRRFARCCAEAFLAYTPLIRSETVLRLAMAVYRVRQQEYLLQAARQVREHRAYGDPLNDAAAA